jgi:hypothetical protein
MTLTIVPHEYYDQVKKKEKKQKFLEKYVDIKEINRKMVVLYLFSSQPMKSLKILKYLWRVSKNTVNKLV